jgi:hypothetical protein
MKPFAPETIRATIQELISLPTAKDVADHLVPEGSLPDSDPDYMTDRDPWSFAYDRAAAQLAQRNF